MKEKLEGLKKQKLALFVIIAILLYAYGAHILSKSFSIDNESITFRFVPVIRDFFMSGRFTIPLLKALTLQTAHVPFVEKFLWLLAMILQVLSFGYFFTSLSGKEHRKGLFFTVTVLFAMLFATHPVFAEQYNFTHQSFEVAMGITFAVSGAYFCVKALGYRSEKKRMIGTLSVSALLTILAFGVYQAIIPLFVGAVCMFLFLRNKAAGKKGCVKDLLLSIGLTVISFVIYFAIVKITQHFALTADFDGTADYMNAAFHWGQVPAKQILWNILCHAKDVFFGEGLFYNVGFSALSIVFLIYSVVISVRRKNLMFVLYSLVIIGSPFLMMAVTGGSSPVRSEFAIPFATAAEAVLLADDMIANHRKDKRLLIPVVAFSLLVIGIFGTQSFTTNRLFHTADKAYENDVNFGTELITRIEEKCGSMNPAEKKILFVGSHTPNLPSGMVKGECIGWSFFEWDAANKPMGSTYRITGFYENMGYSLFSASPEDAEACYQYAKENMPAFPAEGSIQEVNNIIVVKLSEE